jgi:hypothetical protein
MGTEQRGVLSTTLLGSVAEEVLSVVECDVLVVPPGRPGERTSGAWTSCCVATHAVAALSGRVERGPATAPCVG